MQQKPAQDPADEWCRKEEMRCPESKEKKESGSETELAVIVDDASQKEKMKDPDPTLACPKHIDQMTKEIKGKKIKYAQVV